LLLHFGRVRRRGGGEGLLRFFAPEKMVGWSYSFPEPVLSKGKCKKNLVLIKKKNKKRGLEGFFGQAQKKPDRWLPLEE